MKRYKRIFKEKYFRLNLRDYGIRDLMDLKIFIDDLKKYLYLIS